MDHTESILTCREDIQLTVWYMRPCGLARLEVLGQDFLRDMRKPIGQLEEH